MKRNVTRFGTTARLSACALAALFAVPALVQGQAQENVAVQIPYSFTIPASKTPLPAGTYTFSISKASNLVSLVSDTGVTTRQMIVTMLSGPNRFLQEGSLVFDNTGGDHMLSEIWLPGGDAALIYGVPKGHTRAFLSFSDLPATGQVSGKVAYERTCARCHGEAGKGDPNADRYMGVAIPKLNSEQIQSKSDAELKAIISSGTKDMPPVEIEQSGFLHRLPPQDVTAVIAYVRTLKQ
jgi:mono/diheme cytochrome c family protein